ncbi:MAG TPA: VanZ family protein [Intrasporangium sp.]|uniref:VanZ family protein n=1 Tax=Intrasporangium sp. TaxID=1925024 RepID=UPI002D79C408|nr:VanZ family protein [Intrasporangium sp.]HET7397177.1 VanZ family protein [Intrasporangium sp.]
MSTLAAQLGCIVLGLTFVALASAELHRRAGVPRRVSALAGGALLTVAVAVAGSVNATAFFRQVRHGGGFTAYLLLVLSLAVVLVLRAEGLSRVQTALVTEPVLFVATMSWLPAARYAAHLRPDAVSQVRSCVLGPSPVDELSRWLVRTDLLPNVALYVPLGVAVALVAQRRRWLAVGCGLATSVLTELWQAVATNRLCAPSDVLANTAGTALGVAVVVLAAGIFRPDRTKAPGSGAVGSRR